MYQESLHGFRMLPLASQSYLLAGLAAWRVFCFSTFKKDDHHTNRFTLFFQGYQK